jgi:hypothetical protein
MFPVEFLVHFSSLTDPTRTSDPHSWLVSSTISCTNAFDSKAKSVRIGPFQRLTGWRPDCIQAGGFSI